MIIPTEPVFYIKWTAFWVAVLTIIVLSTPKEKYKSYSKYVFMLFVIPVMGSTLYLAGNTVYHNVHSVTGGPIHWHADYQVWVCDKRLDLINPTGMANKIGTPLFHEHNDDRIHVEGTVDGIPNVNLAAFFKTVGGELSTNKLIYVTEAGQTVEVESNKNSCNEVVSQLTVYVNGNKINNVDTYMYYPHPGVPPGDCVIIEFGANLPDTTERICDFWTVEGWNYDNYKELRKSSLTYAPVFNNPDYEYIDGLGVVEVNK